MHLLATMPGTIADGSAAVDLAQSPGDIIVLSSADTEIALLAAAERRRRAQDPAAPRLRLAPILRLGHNFSVDLYMETIACARLVVARLLGGNAYWPYGIERLVETCRAHNIPLALLPGDDNPDPELAELSTVAADAVHRLWSYLAEGGPANAQNLLHYAGSLIGYESKWAEPAALLRAGLHWPDRALPSFDDIASEWRGTAGIVPIVFYRALVQSGNTAPVDALVRAIEARNLQPLPVFVHSLKDGEAASLLGELFAAAPPVVILNATGFSVRTGSNEDPLAKADCPVLQVVFAGNDEESWRSGTRGIGPRDLAMNVALPEIDGRILSRAVSFKAPLGRDPETEADLTGYRPVADRVAFVADLARNWARLRARPPAERRIALIFANYPNRDGRIGNGVGLDTPASAIAILQAIAQAGYRIGDAPDDSQELVQRLLAGPTNAKPGAPAVESLSFAEYSAFFATLPPALQQAITARWGAAERDPFFRPGRLDCGRFAIPGFRAGNLAVLIQPARGYNIDPKSTYHDPALVPPHGYFAAYAWLAEDFRADAMIHLGKHGTLEWLPGKALALSAECFPEAVLAPLPHFYPFIVNDPGEGTQAKRRTQAVIVDHLTPPLTRAGSYGLVAELERLIDEYYEASLSDPRRVAVLAAAILEQARAAGLDGDCGIIAEEESAIALRKLDGFLCELKDLQIRDGLHIFGCSPEGERLHALLTAFARPSRGSAPGDASLLHALAIDLGLGEDLLAMDQACPWTGRRAPVLTGPGPWRTVGDTIERLEELALRLVANDLSPDPNWHQTSAVLDWVERKLRPAVVGCGEAELAGLLAGLDGRFVPPGPSGAPSRGRPEVLPTGRNFYSVDTRAVPTQAAWQLGWKSAALLLERHAQEYGTYPARVALSAWGTANMRTGGDDIAQALGYLGARPVWDMSSNRVTGVEVLPLAKLERPRIDVTLRISGLFRDIFETQIALLDTAIRKIASLDEDDADNPLACSHRRGDNLARIFGGAPGSYGAGTADLTLDGNWRAREDLGEAYLSAVTHAYGAVQPVMPAGDGFRDRVSAADALVHPQDDRERDLLDGDGVADFVGGFAAAAALLGNDAKLYHLDTSEPSTPKARTVSEEIARIVRGRLTNPRWIAGMLGHGHRGVAEIAQGVDALFAFAATTRVVPGHLFDMTHDALIANEAVLAGMIGANPAGAAAIASRLRDALTRGLWVARRNAVAGELDRAIAKSQHDLGPSMEAAK